MFDVVLTLWIVNVVLTEFTVDVVVTMLATSVVVAGLAVIVVISWISFSGVTMVTFWVVRVTKNVNVDVFDNIIRVCTDGVVTTEDAIAIVELLSIPEVIVPMPMV